MFVFLFVLGYGIAQAQIANTRPVNKDGVNVFEAPKTQGEEFEGVKVKVGGDFAIQFQSIDQSNNAEKDDPDRFIELGSNLNLPTANLNIDVQLAKGIRMHMRTYLSARHHNEAWVKGGHLQIDNLDFIKEGFASGLMEVTSLKFGLDEINYGDAHFRRSDNGMALYNPFVGNYIMDAFTTEAFGEMNIMKNGFISVLGISNGKLNQSVVVNSTSDNKLSLYGKVGYDKQMSEDLRFRLTGSFYMNDGKTTGQYLYGGDRAGARYYNIGISEAEADAGTNATNAFTNGRYNPGFRQLTAIQINPFIKYQGLEFFGIYEIASNGDEVAGQENGKFTQIAGEMIYRFGEDEKFYVGGRYNTVKGEVSETSPEIQINRYNLGGGWFLTKNILTKVEYVNQTWEGNNWTGKWAGAGFNGIVLEAVVSF